MARATTALLMMMPGCAPYANTPATTSRTASIRVAGFVEAAGIT